MKKELPITHAHIECLVHLNRHFDMTYKALTQIYPAEHAEEIMEKDYNPAFSQIKKLLHKHMIHSLEREIAS